MSVVVRSLYLDPFSPVLTSSPALDVSLEQKKFIKLVLDKACSDSRFSDKAYVAIMTILTGGSVKLPTITSLTPNNAVIGDPSFTLHVHGTGYKTGSIIVFAGQEEPTTHVSDTELTTGVDMTVWLGADIVPVEVLSPDGVMSAPSNFEFKPSVEMLNAQKQRAADAKPEYGSPAHAAGHAAELPKHPAIAHVTPPTATKSDLSSVPPKAPPNSLTEIPTTGVAEQKPRPAEVPKKEEKK